MRVGASHEIGSVYDRCSVSQHFLMFLHAAYVALETFRNDEGAALPPCSLIAEAYVFVRHLSTHICETSRWLIS